MRGFGWTVAAVGLCFVATACADKSQQVMNKEDMLAASGFKFVPANTAERQASFRQLPPHKFIRQVRGDKVIYIYADPTICCCIGAESLRQNQRRVFDKKIDERFHRRQRRVL